MSLPRQGFPVALWLCLARILLWSPLWIPIRWPGFGPLGTNCTNIVDRLFCGGNASPNFSLRLCQKTQFKTLWPTIFLRVKKSRSGGAVWWRGSGHVTRAWRWGTAWKFASSFYPITSSHHFIPHNCWSQRVCSTVEPRFARFLFLIMRKGTSKTRMVGAGHPPSLLMQAYYRGLQGEFVRWKQWYHRGRVGGLYSQALPEDR